MPRFIVTGTAAGTWWELIEAENEDETRAKMEALLEADDWEPDVEVDDADINQIQQSVRPTPPSATSPRWPSATAEVDVRDLDRPQRCR